MKKEVGGKMANDRGNISRAKCSPLTMLDKIVTLLASPPKSFSRTEVEYGRR